MKLTTLIRTTLAATLCAVAITSVGAYGGQAAPTASAATVSAASKANTVVSVAQSLKGKVRYKFGVNNPSKYIFDCSSFTKYVFSKVGVSLKWGSAAQSKQGKYVSKSNLKKGDLVFFSVSKKGRVNHVGIYIGSGKFIHNTIGSSVNGVIVSDLNKGSYPSRYITARRVL